MANKITENTPLQEILDADVGAEKVLESHGMMCDQCTGARAENIGEAAAGHGVDLDNLLGEINKLFDGKGNI